MSWLSFLSSWYLHDRRTNGTFMLLVPLFGDEKSFLADRRGWRRGYKQVMDYQQALCYVLADVDARTCHCQSTLLPPPPPPIFRGRGGVELSY